MFFYGDQKEEPLLPRYREGSMTRNGRMVGGLLFFVWLAGLILAIQVSPAQSAGELERGKALYRGHCAACHGFDGGGNGPRAAGLTPPPTNFRNATVMRALSGSQLERAILAGKAGTAMKGYGTIFNPQDVASLVQYLRSLSASP